MKMEEWKEYKVADVIEDISMGPFGSNIKRDNYVDSGVPYLNGSNLSSYKLNENSFNYVTEEKANNLGRCVAKRGDIIVTHRGTIGQISYIPNDSIYERYLTGNSQFRLTVNRKVIRPDFFVYYFHTRMGQYRILANASQVGVPALARPTSTFKEVLVPVPKMEIQNKIMGILLSLDDKIAVNRRICENLEAQAQALFKHWFIDFAPFKNGNFCANREQNETSFNSAEVQPKITGKACKFVESELGMIPEGWRVGGLFDIAEVHDSKRKPLSGMQRAKMKKVYPYYGATEQMDMVDDYIFDGRYVLMGEDGSVVRENGLPYIQYVWGKIWVNNHAHVLTGKNGFTTEMLIPFLTTYNIKGLVTGAVQAKLNQANMAKISLAIPPLSILENISVLFESLYDTYRNCCTEMVTLSTLRDTLLPKLMSGQIKV